MLPAVTVAVGKATALRINPRLPAETVTAKGTPGRAGVPSPMSTPGGVTEGGAGAVDLRGTGRSMRRIPMRRKAAESTGRLPGDEEPLRPT